MSDINTNQYAQNLNNINNAIAATGDVVETGIKELTEVVTACLPLMKGLFGSCCGKKEISQPKKAEQQIVIQTAKVEDKSLDSRKVQ